MKVWGVGGFKLPLIMLIDVEVDDLANFAWERGRIMRHLCSFRSFLLLMFFRLPCRLF